MNFFFLCPFFILPFFISFLIFFLFFPFFAFYLSLLVLTSELLQSEKWGGRINNNNNNDNIIYIYIYTGWNNDQAYIFFTSHWMNRMIVHPHTHTLDFTHTFFFINKSLFAKDMSKC